MENTIIPAAIKEEFKDVTVPTGYPPEVLEFIAKAEKSKACHIARSG